VAHDVDEKLKRTLPELEITLHVEPIEDGASWEAAELASLGEAQGPTEYRIPNSPPIDD
jgi:hypothetical protein